MPYRATFHKNNLNSWLDVIILDSQSKLVSFAKSDTPFIDGHDYLLCQCNLGSITPSPKLVTFSNLRVCDHLALSNSLMTSLKIDNTILDNSDPNDLLVIFKTEILSVLDSYAPVLTRRITCPRNPWFTRELKIKCKERDEIYKRAKRNQALDLIVLFRFKRKELKLEINRRQEDYLRSALSNLPYGQTA